VIRRIVALCVCVAALAGCRVDLDVDVTVEPDGTGTITLVATADAEVVAAVPTLAQELATDDIVAAGWTIDGPTALADGGLTITLSHGFTSDAEATNLLNSLGPPFNQMAMRRNTSGEDTTTRLTGLLGLADGFGSFADEELIAAVGSVPFGDQIAASGATPESSINAVIRAGLPGRIDSTATNGIELGDNRLEWRVPMDGTILDWRAVSVQSPGDDRWWARPLSIVALVALVAWVSFMTLFIGYVLWARWQRTRRRSRRTPSHRRAGPTN
jgi:hypothetical protein